MIHRLYERPQNATSKEINATSKRLVGFFFSCHAFHILISALDVFLTYLEVRLGHKYAYFLCSKFQKSYSKVKVSKIWGFFIEQLTYSPQVREGKTFLFCHDLLS